MAAQEGRKLGFNIVVVDPTKHCPASMVADHILGSFNNPEKLYQLDKIADVITYEVEFIDINILKKSIDISKVYPSINILEIIQDKYKQKKFLSKAGIPVPFFKEVKSINDIKPFIPVVQKVKVGGYDGRGVIIIKTEKDLTKALNKPSYIEEFVEIEKELAVIVVRDIHGNIKTYPVVDMVFNKEGNLLDYLIAPATLDSKIENQVKDIASSAVEVLDGIGVFGVELFLDKKGRILLNEIAPRLHNSGHYTIEACKTSQFEQQIRILSNLPLGSTDQMIPAITINLLGENGFSGNPIYEGLEKVIKIDGVYIHIYGKRQIFPLRKMGHVTVIDKDINKALEKAKYVKENLKVKGDRKL